MDGFKESGRFREGFEVDVYGGLAPTVENGRGSTDEINTPGAAHLLAQRGAERFQTVFISKGSHGT